MRFPELPRLTEQQLAALGLMDELAASPECRLDMELEVGDIQLISNYVILHSRTEYEDFPEPEQRRHLLRLWLTLHNGRDLAPDFGRGSSGDNRGRGGIAAKTD